MPPQFPSARLTDAGATIRAPRLAWRGPRPARPLVLAALVVAGVLACVYLVLRLTPLSTVQNVTVVGVQGPKASAIRHAIERAATGQSTLGFRESAVREAVAGTRSVTGVEVHTRFPHGVQVEVHQLVAVGAVESGGRRVAVAADGRLLPDWTVGTLPVIRGGRARDGALVGGGRAAARLLGGAPQPLLARVARVDGGHTVRLADGPALLFRDDHRTAAKWAAAVAVLSDPGTRGATWIDLRVPEQPVAGSGAPPTLPSRDARAGKVARTSDALATAEGLAPAAGATAATGDGSSAAARTAAPAASSGAGTAARADPAATGPTPGSGAAASPTGGSTAQPTAGGTAATTASTAAGPTTGGANARAGTASTSTSPGTDSGANGSTAAPAAVAGAGAQSGGVTATGAQSAP